MASCLNSEILDGIVAQRWSIWSVQRIFSSMYTPSNIFLNISNFVAVNVYRLNGLCSVLCSYDHTCSLS